MTMIQTHANCARPARANAMTGLLGFIQQALAVRKERHALRQLDGDALRDLGLSRDDVARETARKIWDVPATWRK